MQVAIRTITCVAIILASGTAGATTQNLPDRMSWELAVGSFEVEDFETTPLGISCPDSGASITCPSEIVIATPSFDIVLPAEADFGVGVAGIVAAGDVNGTREYRADLHSGVLTVGVFSNTFVFPNPITSFAVDLANVTDELCFVSCEIVAFPMTIELAGESFAIEYGAGFFGVTSTTPFDQVVIRSTSFDQGNTVAASFDDVSFAVVPEPTTAVLFLAGLFAIARSSSSFRSRAT